MNYVVVSRGDDDSNRMMHTFHHLAGIRGMTLNPEEPDIVISIGGDGTMLQAFHLYVHRLDRTSFVGIHTGHLGFFADWKAIELEQLIECVASSTPDNGMRQVHYPLVELEIVTSQGTRTHLALNEFTLKGVESTLVAQININDDLFEKFRGDGICISTPIGSTAYNKSLGGALLHPSLDVLQIAEIASINNRVYRTLGSSMVLPKHHHCDITPRPGQNLLLTLDHISEQRRDILSIRSRVSTQKISFARYRPFPFWRRVREAFLGYETNPDG
ncbi:NAD kinase [Paenibacillus sp. y28]|uniref:NAD kinase n=1 Tax=Paenibacillus sp. y28 TaxID=3129110 RepID=UPI00301B04DB